MNMKKIYPCLWFDDKAEEAANFYVSIFKDSKILDIARYTEIGPGKPGSVVTVTFELNGQKFMGLNGGPIFKFTEAVSFVVDCKDQEEVDYYWTELLAGGGVESQCGWLKDRYGLSWQIVPTIMEELRSKGDEKKNNAMMKAMLNMVKLDVAALRKAYDEA